MEKIIKCICGKNFTHNCEICNKHICPKCLAPINNIKVCLSCRAVIEIDHFNNAVSVRGYYIHCNDPVYKAGTKILGCQNRECLYYKFSYS